MPIEPHKVELANVTAAITFTQANLTWYYIHMMNTTQLNLILHVYNLKTHYFDDLDIVYAHLQNQRSNDIDQHYTNKEVADLFLCEAKHVRQDGIEECVHNTIARVHDIARHQEE